jgi:hypothetical protein
LSVKNIELLNGPKREGIMQKVKGARGRKKEEKENLYF